MFNINVEFGYIYYGKEKRREKILIDSNLRNDLFNILDKIRNYRQNEIIPFFKRENCYGCSMNEFCDYKKCSVKDYIQKMKEEIK